MTSLMPRRLAMPVLTAFLTIGTVSHAHAASMMWSRMLGGNAADRVNGVVTDVAGNVYVVGTTSSSNYPSVGGGYRSPSSGYADVFVAKYGPSGSSLIWTALLGGTYSEEGRAIAVDRSGNVFVTGYTASSNFPATAGAFKTTNGQIDGFITKLSPSGQLLASTFFGGTRGDWPSAILLDPIGDPIVAGTTEAYDFPTTAGVVKPTRGAVVFTDAADGFVAKFSSSLNGIRYGTYFGSTNASDGIDALALDYMGQPVVVGNTLSFSFPTTPGAYQRTASRYSAGFVARLGMNCSGLLFSSYLDFQNADEPRAVGIDASGSIYVSGYTASREFPGFAGGTWDAFLMKLNSTGSLCRYATCFGGAGDDKAWGMTVSPAGEVTLVGETNSANIPAVGGSFDASHNGGLDAFVARFSNTGALVYSSYFGSSGTDRAFAVAPMGGANVALAGLTDGAGFPLVPSGAGSTPSTPVLADAFVSGWSMATGAVQALSQDPADGQTSMTESPLDVFSGASPNPFQDRTMIRLRLSRSANVSLRIRDLQGRIVRSVVSEPASPGEHAWTWDGRTDQGAHAAPGVYFVEASVDHVTQLRRITRVQ